MCEATFGVAMLLLDGRAPSHTTIQRAARLSDALHARLHVVISIGRLPPYQPALFVSQVIGILRACSPSGGFGVEVIDEPLEDRGFEIAREDTPGLVIVEPRIGAAKACQLADRLGAPVLVARGARLTGEVIAASDMRRARFPVLSVARDYARALDRKIVYFHNAKPLPEPSHDPVVGSSTYAGMLALQDNVAEAKSARLTRLATTGEDVVSIVARTRSTVDAVLELARERDADIVVVGHRPRPWFSRLLGQGTTERIIERSRRSVLIVPVGGNDE